MSEPESGTAAEQLHPHAHPAYTPRPGRFVWHDLVTREAEVAQPFYEELFGWMVTPLDLGTTVYRALTANEKSVGGIVQEPNLPEGVPSHWVCYVLVEDLDACVARGTEAGGAVLVPPHPIPGKGRFAMVKDPVGAVLALLELDAVEEVPADWHTRSGSFCWDELHSSDVERATAWYGSTLGWEWNPHDMGPMGTYWLVMEDGKDHAGAMNLPPGVEAPSAWMPYVAVDDVDGFHARALELGGSCWVPPADIPGVGRFAVLADPTGGTFAIHRASKDAC
jgi:predicted enzyme related to lactoylglutathione lyase